MTDDTPLVKRLAQAMASLDGSQNWDAGYAEYAAAVLHRAGIEAPAGLVWKPRAPHLRGICASTPFGAVYAVMCDLKPCPFCGGAAEIERYGDRRYGSAGRPKAALTRARDEALEEAARAAESVGRPVGSGDGHTYVPGSSADAARAIRALKQKEPQS